MFLREFLRLGGHGCCWVAGRTFVGVLPAMSPVGWWADGVVGEWGGVGCYQIPSSFHQPKPTVDQMRTLDTETMAPTRNQSFMETYSWAKNMGDGVVP